MESINHIIMASCLSHAHRAFHTGPERKKRLFLFWSIVCPAVSVSRLADTCLVPLLSPLPFVLTTTAVFTCISRAAGSRPIRKDYGLLLPRTFYIWMWLWHLYLPHASLVYLSALHGVCEGRYKSCISKESDKAVDAYCSSATFKKKKNFRMKMYEIFERDIIYNLCFHRHCYLRYYFFFHHFIIFKTPLLLSFKKHKIHQIIISKVWFTNMSQRNHLVKLRFFVNITEHVLQTETL